MMYADDYIFSFNVVFNSDVLHCMYRYIMRLTLLGKCVCIHCATAGGLVLINNIVLFY